MISCTAGPTQIQSNSLLAQHRKGMVWHASGSDMSRQGRKGPATCVHRLCCHVWLKIAGRQAAKLQSREAWPTQSLEGGLTSRRARRGVCSPCSLGTSWPAAGSLQGRRCPATSRELATAAEWPRRGARAGKLSTFDFAASFQMIQAEDPFLKGVAHFFKKGTWKSHSRISTTPGRPSPPGKSPTGELWHCFRERWNSAPGRSAIVPFSPIRRTRHSGNG